MKTRKTILLSSVIIAAVFLGDQVTKHLIQSHMKLGQAIPSYDSFVSIRYSLNDGVAFSMLVGHRTALIIMQFILVAAILIFMVFMCRKGATVLLATSFALMLGGGMGNLIDRIVFGKVTDFISVGSFPIFNVADICLTTGCVLMLLYIFLVDRVERKMPVSIKSEDKDSAQSSVPDAAAREDEL